MASTTKARVLIVAPELQYMSDEVFNAAIAQANIEVTLSGYGSKQQIAQDWYVAHVVKLIRETSGDVSGGGSYTGNASSAAGGVSKEKVEGLEKQYAIMAGILQDGNRFDETSYGRIFNTIKPIKKSFSSTNFAAGC